MSTQQYFVHESACIDHGAQIGVGAKIWHYSHVLSGSEIGTRCVIGQNVMVGPDVVLGDGCKIQNNCVVCKGVTFENDVFCGPGCLFTNVINPRAFIERKDEFRSTRVLRGASLGAASIIVCGVTIGRYAFVGAGAVVTKDVGDHCLVYGNPARLQGYVCACAEKLIFEGTQAVCAVCSRVYVKENEHVRESESV